MIDLRQLQDQIGDWSKRNFGVTDRTSMHCVLGVSEETGELSHAILKREQGIRGTRDEHDEAAKDAVADIVIYLLNLCSVEGWDFSAILVHTALKVIKRNWLTDPVDGVSDR